MDRAEKYTQMRIKEKYTHLRIKEKHKIRNDS